MYGTKRTEGFEPFGYIERTDVAGMPHFIALGKVLDVALIPVAVGPLKSKCAPLVSGWFSPFSVL